MKKLNILILAMIALAGLTFVAPRSWAQGVDNPAVFELDGNTANDPALAGQDWDTVTPLTANPIQDPAPQTIFATGQSKDINDVSQWRWTNGSVPDKDNILQAVATALPLPNGGGTAIYFAASRFDNSGSAQMGFWFFQQNVAPQGNPPPNGTFGPAPGQVANHTDGDLLLLVNFTGGGLVASIQVYKWQGGVTGGPVLDNDPNLLTGQCGPGNLDVCAITNPTDTPAPSFWNYQAKGGTLGTFPLQTFFEGGVNLNKIFPTGVPCFSSFLAETRSSPSITSVLKDFAEGNFNLCKITVTKNCSAGVVINNGTQVQYTFSGTVTNSGAGNVYDVQVIDTPGNATGTQTPANPIPVVGTDVDGDGNADDLAPGASGTWSATFVTTSLGFTDQALAQAAAAPGGLKTVTDTTTKGCQTPVSSAISITKFCVPGTTLVDIGANVVVQVGVSGQVTNNGNTSLSGITLADNPTATITFDSSTPLAPGQSRNWSATYRPAAISSGDGTIPGRYFFDDTIRVTAATPALGDPLPFAVGCPDAHDLACDTVSCAICPPGSCNPTP
jgi:hypothetical protein